MSKEQTELRQLAAADDSAMGFIDLMLAVVRKKSLVIGLPIAAALISAAASFLLPDVYKASTNILPPQPAQSGATALLSQLGGVVNIGGGGAGSRSDLYVGMLKSRTVADRLITQFNLKKAYGTDSQELARKKLEENTEVILRKDGLLSIAVEDRSKELVAKLANAYVAELVALTNSMALTEAARRRMFFEGQLNLAKTNLAKAEVLLKDTLGTKGVISIDSESQSVVATTARLRAQISAQEIRMDSMKAFVTPSHQDFKRGTEELNSLRAELSKLENGRDNGARYGQSGPDAKNGIASIQLLRDVKYHQMLYEVLAKEYESARIDEAKDPPTIQVLDPAIDPEKKFKPKRVLIVSISTLLALFVAIFLALLSELSLRMLRSPARAAKWIELQRHIRFK